MNMRTPLISLAVAIILQVSLVQYVAIKWFRPDLPLIVLLFIAMRRDVFISVLLAFVSGLLVDSLSAGFLGVSSTAYALSVFISGKLFKSDIPLSLINWAVASAIGSLLFGIVYAYFYSKWNIPLFYVIVIKQAVPTALFTWMVAVLWSLTPFYDLRRKVAVD